MQPDIRQRTLEREKATLSEYAALCSDSLGRERYEEECPVRTAYQRDRDRILHCNAFRRLKDKTQVFLSPSGDHYRTRLTHTLEVSQIARTIARSLMLNEDLTEAVALGHDLGHTPFGHAGERALCSVYPDGFCHYEQSVRVITKLENSGKGLNLTREVIDGIYCHTEGKEAGTLEGRLIRLADKIAYINHDIDDAVRGSIISEDELPEEVITVLGRTKSERINTLVMSVIENTRDTVRMSPDVTLAFDKLHDYMFKNVYTNPLCKGEESKAMSLVISLFEYYSEHYNEMPAEFQYVVAAEGAQRAACDFVAGMTDRYALSCYGDIFIPSTWEYSF